MHDENLAPSADFAVRPPPPELVDGPAAVPPPDELVPRLATEGAAEPPHPAASDARATSMSTQTATRAWRDRITLPANRPFVKRL
jgi:hypothetical protein